MWRPPVSFCRQALTATLLLAAAPLLQAEAVEFDFKDPKGVNGLVFVMDSQLEPIVGMVGGVTGTVEYDPADPTTFAGEISVDIGQISFINPGMTKVLQGADWLDIADRFITTMRFDSAKLAEGSESADAEPGTTKLEVEATLIFGEEELPMTLPLSVTHLPDAAADRGAAKEGDLLLLRSEFSVSRIDLGINPEQPTDKVGPMIRVMVPIAGYSK
jgi:polyisoprenoid-binding protein YceI